MLGMVESTTEGPGDAADHEGGTLEIDLSAAALRGLAGKR